jgi:N-methylhydantoinase A
MSGTVGIDVGGTYTDLYFSGDDGRVERVIKVPSTPSDPSIGLIDALRAAEIKPADLDQILHGTTIATNAVIERRGARCALITTRGFRDVLELGRRDRPNMYGLTGIQRPLVPRDQRWEVDERLDHEGNVLIPLRDSQVRELAIVLKGEKVDAVVVSLLHSYANPAHEERIRDILREIEPNWELVISSGVIREYYEFERTSTAVIQGYLQPLVSRYAKSLLNKLGEWGFDKQTLIMQSNGGVVPVSQLADRAAYIVRSGPAAGVMAAGELAAQAGFDRIITGDMGGTSFDVAVVIEGKPAIAENTLLDFRLPLRLPMIDVHTIGAGGGSIAHIDRAGILQVGPESAGAYPGPVCWGRGGTEPTVTDANVVLARIDPSRPIGIERDSLDVEAARKAVGELGQRLGLGIEETAEAMLAVVNQRMAGRIRLLSIERGHDPRDFALVAFGGAGPVHGAALMQEVGIGAMLVPPFPGVLCAMGCASANVRYDLSRTVEKVITELEPAAIAQIMREQRHEGEAQVRGSDAVTKTLTVSHAVDMAYLGQIHAMRVPVEADWPVGRMIQAFNEAYRAEFGNALGGIPVMVINVRTTVEGVRTRATPKTNGAASAAKPKAHKRRQIHFAEWRDTPIYRRGDLAPGMTFAGPAVIEQSDTTTVVEPRMKVKVDAFGNLIVEGA